MGEPKYRDFTATLIPTVDKDLIIGIRTPLLRAYSRSLCEYDSFLKALPHRYFEENNLHAFLLERESDFDALIKRLDLFLPYIDNWATCDSLKPRALKKHPQKLFENIKRWIASDNVYEIRFGINMLMTHFLDGHFSADHLYLVANIKSEEYYVNMARAWYFATALAKQYDDALPLIKGNLLDRWTHNKTVQKSIESLRIPKDRKEYLRSLKRRT